MNSDKYLIIVKGEDKTEKIQSINYNGMWEIVYYSNSYKTYKYSGYNIEYYKNPIVISGENNIVYENNNPISGIKKMLFFDCYIKIFFTSGYRKLYNRSSIVIEETCLKSKSALDCFEYLKRIAEYVGIKVDNDTSYLYKQYSKIKAISPSSIFSKYIEKKPIEKDNADLQFIFPFGFNLSQKSAVERAMTNQLSVIEGPPGTGKTQTILNIIANAIINKKTVAVVSNNNSATVNVLEKLAKYNTDFIAAYLGNIENKTGFLSEQNGAYPNMSEWKLEYKDFQSIKDRLAESQKKLNQMLAYQNSLAIAKNELSALMIEIEYFNNYYKNSNNDILKLKLLLPKNADRILSLMIDYKKSIEKGSFSFSIKLFNLIAYGILDFAFYNNSPEMIISFLQKNYYERKISKLKRKVDKLLRKLKDYRFNEEMKEYSNNSMKLFKAKLVERYGLNSERYIFNKDELWKNFSVFNREYPVILSTTHSLRNCTSENYLFDYVIVDEASQVDIVSGGLVLSCAKNAVVVGDLKQLPNIVTDEVKNVTSSIFELYKLDSAYDYANNSLLSSILDLYKDIPKTLLKEHYRCHPKIIGFCNQKFYNNQLIILTDEKDNEKPLVLYKTAKGNHARGKLNQRQIDTVFEEIIPELEIDCSKQTIGIISPYRFQANELKRTIGESHIDADTVHKYQGRERDIIILSTVVNELSVDDFADNPNLVNVAVSRAIDKLIVVTSDRSEEWKGTNIGDLVSYIQYNNFEIIESKLYSVFDLLYSNYSEKLLEYISKNKNVSEYKSENLMNIIIEKVLGKSMFKSLGYVIHQPLRMLIKDTSKLTEDECKYAMNILTHTDFLIFNKVDKRPILVVEVDGYTYHVNNPKQLKRDKMKDNILQKYDIPILRIKTNGSGEERKLSDKLMEILRLG